MCAQYGDYNNYSIGGFEKQAIQNYLEKETVSNVANILGINETAQEVGDKYKDFDPDKVSKDNKAFSTLDSKNAELKQLESLKSLKVQEITKQQNRIALINSGKEETVFKSKDNADKAYDNYLKKLNKAAEKTTNPEVKALAEAVIATETEITQTEKIISDCSTEISNTNGQIGLFTAQISSLEGEIQAYSSRIGALRSKDPNGKNSSAQAEINSLIAAKGSVQSKKKNCAAAKLMLENKKKDLENTKLLQEEHKNLLQTKKEELNAKVLQTLDKNIVQALNKYNELKQVYETTKSNALADAQTKLTEAQTEANEIDAKITAKKQEIFLKEQEEKKAQEAKRSSQKRGRVYSGSGSDGSGEASNILSTQRLQELAEQAKQALLTSAGELTNIFDGNNNTVKAAADKKNLAFEGFISKLQTKDIETAKNIQLLKDNLDNKETGINNIEKQLINAEIGALNSQSLYNKCAKDISALQNQQAKLQQFDASGLTEDKKMELDSLKQKIAVAISQKQQELQMLQTKAGGTSTAELELRKSELETEYQQIKQELLEKMKTAAGNDSVIMGYHKAFADSVTSYETVKTQEINTKKDAYKTSLAQYNESEELASDRASSDAANEYRFGGASCNYDLTLTDYQKRELGSVKNIFLQNRQKYEAVSNATGVPAELICAMHYRESGCNFNTYLHNGDPLGKPTVHVPKGKMFNDWTSAAIDALRSVHVNVNDSDVNTQLDFAEHFNGLGYKKKGVTNPYLWAGTSNYSGGMFVADHVYSSTAKDKRVGVAAILKTLYETA